MVAAAMAFHRCDHWLDYHRRWSRLRPPLRPNREVIEGFRRLSAPVGGPALLLGVTPELADITGDVTAVDRSQAMIDRVWPGDTGQRRARRADWLELDDPPGSFSLVVGDGSCNVVPHAEGASRLLQRLLPLLRSGGRAVLRIFTAPDQAERICDVRDAVLDGCVESFHGFKWRLAMALAGESADPNIAVTAIRDAFQKLFPDRVGLSRRTGWAIEDIDTIDVYRNSTEVYCFPTRRQVIDGVPAGFGGIRFVEVGTYELAERCPLLVLDKP